MLMFVLLFQAAQNTPIAPAAPQVQVQQDPKGALEPAQLLKVKRILVDSFGDDPTSKEVQSMIVSALVSSKRFVVTENREHADAILKGVALEKTSQEVHSYHEGTAVHTAGGDLNGGFAARGAATSDSSMNTETVDRARLAVRLVNLDGDVIWTTTQESKGAKYKGAAADAVDLCVKQLVKDITRLDNTSSNQASTPGQTAVR